MTGVHVYSRHRTLESLGDVFIKSILVVSVVTRLNEENVNCGSCSFKKKYECQRLNSTPFMTLTSLIFGLPHATTSWENIGKNFGESMACALLDFFFQVFVSVGLSESATTVHTGHRTKRANYNDKLLSTELYIFFPKRKPHHQLTGMRKPKRFSKNCFWNFV